MDKPPHSTVLEGLAKLRQENLEGLWGSAVWSVLWVLNRRNWKKKNWFPAWRRPALALVLVSGQAGAFLSTAVQAKTYGI